MTKTKENIDNYFWQNRKSLSKNKIQGSNQPDAFSPNIFNINCNQYDISPKSNHDPGAIEFYNTLNSNSNATVNLQLKDCKQDNKGISQLGSKIESCKSITGEKDLDSKISLFTKKNSNLSKGDIDSNLFADNKETKRMSEQETQRNKSYNKKVMLESIIIEEDPS